MPEDLSSETLAAERPTSAPAKSRRLPWRAWHIFLDGPDALDDLVVSAVQPAAAIADATDGASWFFLRYWENGHHLRFRARGLSRAQAANLGERFRATARAIVERSPQEGARIHTPLPGDGWHLDPQALPVFPQGSVEQIAYEPEIRRYGGTQGLALNEALFADSSRLALRVIAGTAGKWKVRQRIALELFAAAAGVFAHSVPERLHFAGGVARSWAGLADASAGDAVREIVRQSGTHLLQVMDAGGTGQHHGLHPLTREWIARLSDYLEDAERLAAQGRIISPLTGIPARGETAIRAALGNMLASQTHMLNNRLGISPLFEYLFAQAVVQAHDIPAEG